MVLFLLILGSLLVVNLFLFVYSVNRPELEENKVSIKNKSHFSSKDTDRIATITIEKETSHCPTILKKGLQKPQYTTYTTTPQNKSKLITSKQEKPLVSQEAH